MTKKEADGTFEQPDRVKLDVRVSKDLDDRIERAARMLGTTKNSIAAVGVAMFVSKILSTKGKKSDVEIERALRELASA